jgi:excisionase family DNA binding protein
MAELALTVKEAAEALGISESSIYWMCYMKKIPHRGCKGKGKILISRKALEKWLEG